MLIVGRRPDLGRRGPSESRRSNAGSPAIRTSPRSPASPRPARGRSSPATATSTYLAVGARADRRRRDPGRRRADRRLARGRARGQRRRLGGRPGAGQRAGRERPAPGRAARLPAPLPALAALLPQPGRRAAAAAGRRAGDRRHVPDAARRQRARLDLDLRPQPGHRPRARPGDRLQPVHRLALPRGDRPHRARAGGDAADDGDRRAHGPVQLADRRRRARLAARLPAALPLLDGDRRLAGRADRRRDRAGRPAGGARPARRAGQLALARLPPPPRRARRPARHGGLLVPALAAGDAVPGPDRRGQRGAADRARDPVPRRSSSPPSTPRCCPSRPARARSTTRCAPSSRPSTTRRSSLELDGADERRGRAGRRRGRAGRRGRRGQPAAAARRRRSTRSRRSRAPRR